MEAPIGQSYGCCSLWSLDPISGLGTNTTARTTISICKRGRGFQGLGDARITAMCASSSSRRRNILLGLHFCCGCSSSRGGLGPTRLTHAGSGREWQRVVLGKFVSVSLDLSEQRPAGDGERGVFPPARPRQEPDGPSTEDRPVPAATTRETGRNGAGSRRARSNQPNHRRRYGNIALSTIRQSCSGG
jgi:hypothetical protein